MSIVWAVSDAPCHCHSCLENNMDFAASSPLHCTGTHLCFEVQGWIFRRADSRPEKSFVPYHRTGAEVPDTFSGYACSSHMTLSQCLHLSVLKTLTYRGSVISPLTCFSPVISDTVSTAEDLQTCFHAVKPQDKENKASVDAKISKPPQPDCAHHFVMGEKFCRGVQAAAGKGPAFLCWLCSKASVLLPK